MQAIVVTGNGLSVDDVENTEILILPDDVEVGGFAVEGDTESLEALAIESHNVEDLLEFYNHWKDKVR